VRHKSEKGRKEKGRRQKRENNLSILSSHDNTERAAMIEAREKK
jgi:hypothetical protein